MHGERGVKEVFPSSTRGNRRECLQPSFVLFHHCTGWILMQISVKHRPIQAACNPPTLTPLYPHPSRAQLICAISVARYSVMKASAPLSFISIYWSIYITMLRACGQIQGNLASYKWTDEGREGLDSWYQFWSLLNVGYVEWNFTHLFLATALTEWHFTVQVTVVFFFTGWRKLTCIEFIVKKYQRW